jgi:hypothetical protein
VSLPFEARISLVHEKQFLAKSGFSGDNEQMSSVINARRANAFGKTPALKGARNSMRMGKRV